MEKDNSERDGNITKRRTVIRRRPLSSIPKTTMRGRTEDKGSILDLPAKLLEIQKRLQYVAQEVEKARERGEDVTPKIETGGNLNIGGYELDLNNISKSLSSGEGAQGLEKMLNTEGLGGLLKNILGGLDIEKLKSAVEECSKSSGYEGSGKKPVIGTSIKISQLGENPRAWTGLSGSGAGIVSDKNKGSGSTGIKYQKGGKKNSYESKTSGLSIGSINKEAGRTGQKIEKTRKTYPTMPLKEDLKLKDLVEKELDYQVFPKGDKNYEIIVNDLCLENIDLVKYDKDQNTLVINEKLKIPLKGYKIEKVLDWEYRNNILTINLKK